MKPKPRNVDPAEARKLMANRDLFILDVRTPFEFRGGSITGAVLIPVDQLGQNLDLLPEDKNNPILVYCGHGIRSLTAQALLTKEGFTEVINLNGGIAAFLGHEPS